MGKNSNSGVDGASGYTFQRCCIVFLLFDGFEDLKLTDFFICVEHHEDFLFAFLDEENKIRKIDTYQAKKSRDDWSTNKDLCEIIGKISLVGAELLKDSHPKSSDYSHVLNFLTNKNIVLKGKKEKGKKDISEKIQISNKSINFSSLHDEIKSNIQSKIVDGDNSNFLQLENISFKFIDLPQSYKGWRRILTGLSTEVLGDSVNDHEAVITTLMQLLQDIELTYNNNEIVLLGDENKRLTKVKLDNTLKMFIEYNKTFDFWRSYSDELSKKLKIKLPIKRKAKELLINCFDYFKDIQQIEFKKIYNFIKERTDIDENNSSEVDCIVELYNLYLSEYQPRLENHMVAFAVIAAFVETRGMYD